MSISTLQQTTIANKRRNINSTQIRDMFLLGFTAAKIGAAFGMTRRAVRSTFRSIGLISGRHRHKRDVLPNGKIRCSVCHRSKKASKFSGTNSYCGRCSYAHTAKQSNQDMDQAIHIRNVWFRNRAKRLHIPYDLTDEQLNELYVIQGGRCAYCDKAMVMELGAGRKDCSASIERIIPQKRGGTYTLKNVVWVHFRCNCRRQDMVGKKLKARFPEASKAIEKVAQARQLELPFPTDSHIDVTNDPQPQPAAA